LHLKSGNQPSLSKQKQMILENEHGIKKCRFGRLCSFQSVDFKVPAVNFAKCITNPIPTPHAIFCACGNERLFGAVAGSQTNTAAIFQQTFRSLGKRRNVTGAQTNKLNYMYKPFWGLYDTFPTCWHF